MQKELATYKDALADQTRKPSGTAIAGIISALMHFQIPLTNYKPDRANGPITCIYGLFDNGELVYIGQTKDLVTRISSHRGQKEQLYNNEKPKQFDAFGYLHFYPEDLDLVERRLVRSLLPRYNARAVRKGWGRVIVDDLAHALDIHPKVITDICESREIPITNNIVELMDVIPALAGSDHRKIFSPKC